MLVNKDVAAGLFFIGLGALGLIIGYDYAFGTAAKMGAGFVPKLLAWTLIGLGGIVALAGLAGSPDRMEAWAFGPLLVILSAVLVFAAMLEPVGLEGATISAVLIASSGQASQNLLQKLLLIGCIAALSVVLFPGVKRLLGATAVDMLFIGSAVALLIHFVIYALGSDVRQLAETFCLALTLAVLCVIVFADLLGLQFKSLFVMKAWLPIKTSIFVPIYELLRDLFRGRPGA